MTTIDFEQDMTWFRWLADADAWLDSYGHFIAATTWLVHLAAPWDSPQRIIVANQVLECLSRDMAAQARRAIPVLRFIECSECSV